MRIFRAACLFLLAAFVLCFVATLAQTSQHPIPSSGGAAAWGSITGTLSSQTDLNTALSGKAASNASTTVNGASCALGSTCAPYGGANTYTTSHTIGASDIGKLVVMNCSAACAVTFEASPAATDWWGVESIGSTVATVSLNSKNYNGAASVPVLNSFRDLRVWSDGTNYFGDAPLVAGSNVTLTPASNGVTISSASVPSHIQSKSARATSITSPFNVTSGHVYLIGLGWYQGANTASSISDNLSSTCTKAIERTGNATSNVAIFVCTAGSTGSLTVTGTFPSGGGFTGIGFSEFLNVTATTDGTATGYGSAGSFNLASITTTTDGDLVWTYSDDESSSAVCYPPAGFYWGSYSTSNDSGAVHFTVQPKAGLIDGTQFCNAGNNAVAVVALKHS